MPLAPWRRAAAGAPETSDCVTASRRSAPQRGADGAAAEAQRHADLLASYKTQTSDGISVRSFMVDEKQKTLKKKLLCIKAQKI